MTGNAISMMSGTRWPAWRARARKQALAIIIALATGLTFGSGSARAEVLHLAVTTSIEASGLTAHLASSFEDATGISLRAIVAGTGQALDLARRGDVDATLTHDSTSEQALIEEGIGLERREVMENDFVLIGPDDDPAAVVGMIDIVAAMGRIAASGMMFLSRGDDSGTHKAELRLWRIAGLAPAPDDTSWYLETGLSQGANLNMATARGAYTLIDRATWLASGNRAGLAVMVEGDPRLVNRYGLVLIDPRAHAHVNAAGARTFADWLASPSGRAAIAALRVDGISLFRPAAEQH
jgi:tungstate transport system substrate-binding protein